MLAFVGLLNVWLLGTLTLLEVSLVALAAAGFAGCILQDGQQRQAEEQQRKAWRSGARERMIRESR